MFGLTIIGVEDGEEDNDCAGVCCCGVVVAAAGVVVVVDTVFPPTLAAVTFDEVAAVLETPIAVTPLERACAPPTGRAGDAITWARDDERAGVGIGTPVLLRGPAATDARVPDAPLLPPVPGRPGVGGPIDSDEDLGRLPPDADGADDALPLPPGCIDKLERPLANGCVDPVVVDGAAGASAAAVAVPSMAPTMVDGAVDGVVDVVLVLAAAAAFVI